MSLTKSNPQNTFAGELGNLKLKTYSRGMGALGLPGDYSSTSRFIKASYLLQNGGKEGSSNIAAHSFRILQAVAPPMGSVITPDGKPHYTVYSCCMEPLRGLYHYQRYEEVNTVTQNIFEHPLNGASLHSATG